jgi:outer membrane immunogenic protein
LLGLIIDDRPIAAEKAAFVPEDRSMRSSIVSLAIGLLGASAAPLAASAADLGPPGVLRGPLPASEASMDWSGFYVGGFGGFSQMEFDPRSGASGLVRTMLTSTVWLNPGRADDVVIQRRTTSNKVIYGGYAGYNWMIDDYVIGAEVDYTRGRLDGTATGGRSGFFGDPDNTTLPRNEFRYTTTVSSKLKLTEMGTLRARFGVPFNGNFMPFVTAGLALGRFSYGNDAGLTGEGRAVAVDVNGNPAYGAWGPAGTYSLRDGSRTRFAVGYALGAGIDWALTPNIVVRGELMHVRFGNAGDTSASINTARAGAAVKF